MKRIINFSLIFIGVLIILNINNAYAYKTQCNGGCGQETEVTCVYKNSSSHTFSTSCACYGGVNASNDTLHYFITCSCGKGKECISSVSLSTQIYCGYKDHTCSLHVCNSTKCDKKHCGITYCSLCETHTCSGGCDSSGYCNQPHCSTTSYCTKCGHSCSNTGHNTSGYCSKGHCLTHYCNRSDGKTVCTHTSCGGDHTYQYCSLPHCNVNYCTRCGGHTCSGSHNPVTCGKVHCAKKYCSKSNTEGTSYNGFTCGTHTCGGDHINSQTWSIESGKHVAKCSVSGCSYNFTTHTPSWSAWTNLNVTQHQRICNTCNASSYNNKIKEQQNHSYTSNYTAINDIAKHNVNCSACNNLTTQVHTDTVAPYYECDRCGEKLWRLTYTPSTLTGGSNNVTANLDLWKNTYCSSTNTTGTRISKVFTSNGTFDFVLTDPARNIPAKVDWINRTVKGRIVYSPMESTSGSVTATFVPDYEEDAYGDKLKTGKTITSNPTSYTFTKNGTKTFTISDTIGNTSTITAEVTWIIEKGRVTVSTPYNVMPNGTIFTNILVKSNDSWSASTLADKINISVKKVGGSGTVTAKKSITEITNYYTREKISNTTTSFGKGIYYIRLAMGGPGVFESGTYEVNINGVNTISGKNKIEVKVTELPDLT